MTMNETVKPDAHAVARLALEAAPHLDLLSRIGGSLDLVLRAAAVLGQDWTEIQAAMSAAESAPPALQPAFYRATWDTYAKKHGLTPELMGALAHERRKTQAAPKPEVRAETAQEQPRTVNPPPPETPAAPDRPVSKRPPEQLDALALVLDQMQPMILAYPGTRKALSERLATVDVRLSASSLASISTGWMARAARTRTLGGVISLQLAEDALAALQLLQEAEKQTVMLKATPPPVLLPPAPPAPVRADQPPTSRKGRKALIQKLLKDGGGMVHVNQVAHACQIPHGPATALLRSLNTVHTGSGNYRDR